MDNSLFVDLGNSSIKWSMASEVGSTPASSFNWQDGSLASQLEHHWGPMSQPRTVWAAAVAPAKICTEFSAWAKRRWSLDVRFMQTTSSCNGVLCGYSNPSRLGVDRWAAIIAAHHRYPDGVCVVDCGTAVTIDAVGLNGQHLGGFILPGLQLMNHALRHNTAIPDCSELPASGEWGTDTATAIFLGGRKAISALVEQSVERLQAAGVCDPGLILTGGDRAEVAGMIELAHDKIQDLVLEGLLLWAGEQQ